MTQQAAPSRSEDEIFARFGLKLVLGGIEKSIRQLPARRTEEWRGELGAALSGRLISFGNLESVESIAGAFAGLTDLQVHLLCTYDIDGRLGGIDWILDNATPAEIWAAFKQVIFATFPFLADAAKAPNVVGLLLPQLLELLQSGRSPNGAST